MAWAGVGDFYIIAASFLEMVRRSVESDIDRLYQLPLGEFIAERNALAKRAGDDVAEVRGLQKPTVPAWAVNQLYWQKPSVYSELIDRALKATIELLESSGSPVTDATRQAIGTTLRSLPSDEPPGRLTRQLEPRGFEILGGAAPGRVRTAPIPLKPAKKETKTAKVSDRDAARIAAARQAVAAAAKNAREADQLVRREEFEAARATREAEKAERRVANAEQALEQARQDLDDARRAAAIAAKARDTAVNRAAKAAGQLSEAQTREQSARKQLETLE